MSIHTPEPILPVNSRKQRRWLKRMRNKRERRLSRSNPLRAPTYRRYGPNYW